MAVSGQLAGKLGDKADESVLLDVFVVGVIGGCFSTLLRVQRFQISGTESFHRLTSLPWNALLIIRSLLLGGLGAVVLCVVMRSKLLPLPFFPAFNEYAAVPRDALDSVFASPVTGPENGREALHLLLSGGLLRALGTRRPHPHQRSR